MAKWTALHFGEPRQITDIVLQNGTPFSHGQVCKSSCKSSSLLYMTTFDNFCAFHVAHVCVCHGRAVFTQLLVFRTVQNSPGQKHRHPVGPHRPPGERQSIRLDSRRRHDHRSFHSGPGSRMSHFWFSFILIEAPLNRV